MPPSTSSPPLDLIIIGAGIYGTYAASTYLNLHPAAYICVLNADSGPAGGVWSKSRLYPKFYSQTGGRLCGFPEFPFKVPEGEKTFHDLFEAKWLSAYFEAYLDREVGEGGMKLWERFCFGVFVERVWKEDLLWYARGKRKMVWGLGEKLIEFRAKKMIVATGMYTQTFVPDLPGRDKFSGPILHQKDFEKSKILTPEESEIQKHGKISILGGSKSAAHIAYAAATDPNQEREVTWIIRTSGTGPLLLTHSKGFGKYKSLPEVGSTRIVASLSTANPYVEESWWSWFLHRTPVGEWLLGKIWSKAAGDAAELAGFGVREGRLEGFEGLRSSTSTRWRSGQQGILQQEDWWDVVAKKVHVVRGEIERLEEGKIVMDDGRRIESDVLLAATGWVRGHTIFSSGDKARLG